MKASSVTSKKFGRSQPISVNMMSTLKQSYRGDTPSMGLRDAEPNHRYVYDARRATWDVGCAVSVAFLSTSDNALTQVSLLQLQATHRN